MKILLYVHELTFSGSPSSCLRLARALKELGHAVEVWSFKDGPYKAEYCKYGISVFEVKKNDLREYRFRRKYTKFDLMIANSILTSEAVAAISTYIPSVWYIREAENIPSFFMYQNNYKRGILLKNAQCIWTVSDYASKYVNTYFNSNTYVLHNCIDDYYKNDNKIINRQNSGKVRFAMVGTIEKRKNFTLLVDAFKGLSQSDLANSELHLIGRMISGESAYYHAFIEKIKNTVNIKYYGEINDRDKLLRKMSEMDVIVVASKDESCSLTALEGAMLAKPLIVTENVGAKYIVDYRNGWIVKTDSVYSLRNAIHDALLKKDSLPYMGMISRDNYLKTSTFEIYKDNVNAAIDSLKLNCIKKYIFYLKNIIKRSMWVVDDTTSYYKYPEWGSKKETDTLYSFDIFDTVITRDVGSPLGIFALMQQVIIEDEEFIDVQDEVKRDFVDLRVRIEALAREAHCRNGVEDKTIDQIYDAMVTTGKVSASMSKKLLNLEKETEYNHCIGVDNTVASIKKLRREGKRVVLISDMYMDSGFIRKMLLKVDDVFADIPIYVSSECKYMKGTTNLYKYVLSVEKVSFHNWYHVGDNINADHIAPDHLGIQSTRFDELDLYGFENELVKKYGNCRLAQLLIGNSRIACMKAGGHYSESFRFGCWVGAFSLYPYIMDILHTAEDRKKDIAFVADSQYIKDIIDLIIERLEINVNTSLLPYSYLSLALCVLPNDVFIRRLQGLLSDKQINQIEEILSTIGLTWNEIINRTTLKTFSVMDEVFDRDTIWYILNDEECTKVIITAKERFALDIINRVSFKDEFVIVTDGGSTSNNSLNNNIISYNSFLLKSENIGTKILTSIASVCDKGKHEFIKGIKSFFYCISDDLLFNSSQRINLDELMISIRIAGDYIDSCQLDGIQSISTRDLITYNVRDTLLTSRFGTNYGLMLHINEELKKRKNKLGLSNQFLNEFAEARIAIEDQLRNGRYGVSLDMVYATIRNKYNIPKDIVDVIMQIEKETVKKSVIGIFKNISRFRNDLLCYGKRVLIVSNTVYDAEFIKELLIVQEPLFKDTVIYASSEHDIKEPEDLFKIVQEKEHVDVKNWLHIGRDLKFDINRPQKIGICTERVPEIELMPYEKAALAEYNENRIFQVAIGISKELRCIDESLSVEERIGSSIGGGMLYGYVQWVLMDAINRGTERLLFVARDGFVLKLMADIIVRKQKLDIETRYIYGSRKAWRVPSFSEGDTLDLFFQMAHIHQMEVNQFAGVFDLSIEELQSFLPFDLYTNRKISNEEVEEWCKSLESNREFKQYLSQKSSWKRKILSDYILQETENKRCAFVELSGTGTTQNALAKVWKEIKNEKMYSYFLNLDRLDVAENAVFKNYWPNNLSRIWVVETMCRALHPQTNGYKKQGDRIIPIFQDSDEQKRLVDHGYDDYIRGVMKYTWLMAENQLLANSDKTDSVILNKYLKHIIYNPCDSIKEFVGDMPFESTGITGRPSVYAPRLTDEMLKMIFFVRKQGESLDLYYDGADFDFSIKRMTLDERKRLEYYRLSIGGKEAIVTRLKIRLKEEGAFNTLRFVFKRFIRAFYIKLNLINYRG